MSDHYTLSAKKLFAQIQESIAPYWGNKEASGIAYLLIENFFQIKKLDVIIDKEIVISKEAGLALKKAISRLKKGEPVQYLLQEAIFYGPVI